MFPSSLYHFLFYMLVLFSTFVCLSSAFFPPLSVCFRYFFPPLDPPRGGTRHGHLLPPSSLIEPCDTEPFVQPQQLALVHRRASSRALLSLPEAEEQ